MLNAQNIKNQCPRPIPELPDVSAISRHCEALSFSDPTELSEAGPGGDPYAGLRGRRYLERFVARETRAQREREKRARAQQARAARAEAAAAAADALFRRSGVRLDL